MESIGPRELAADLPGGIVSPGFKIASWIRQNRPPTAKSQNAAAAISESPPRVHAVEKSCGQLFGGRKVHPLI